MKPKKSWREKLADSKDLPKIVEVVGERTKRWGEGTFVVPAPAEVDALMKRVPKGRLVTTNELRAALAAQHGTNSACPLTTGIFSWIAAHAATEAEAVGAKRVTPYWRTLKLGGEVNAKYPGGLAGVCARLKAEGHEVRLKGRRCFVVDYERKLVSKLA